ncbi:hypothetical protein M3147_10960 [Agromyces mediolanus]|uniref:DUF6941 family protein n=1 Tax=Agromyces mediolanus TaxID=41986 RepID=UPI00203C9B9E|nr:hypothetical protein [Agromyces mediolanus]MCM3657771.1 hypothetical protein [Agromyces mediolanus]
MSDIAQAATVNIVLADFANNDAGGKGNIIGAGITLVGFDFQQGVTSKFAIWISVRIPIEFCPAEFPLEMAIVDADDNLVSLPGPAGESQPLRIAQIVSVERPNVQVPAALRDHVGGQIQFVFDFNNGLPLAPNGRYEVRVRLDGDDSRTWKYSFAVVGQAPGPVVG